MKVIATTRNTQGTGASRRLRRADKLPGIIYGGKEPATPIELEHNPIFYALKKEKFHASILTMELDGQEQLVVLRAFQMHPYKPQVMHIDFQRIAANEPVTMRVPLHFHGEEDSPAVKVDKALISHTASFVEVTCLPKLLPEFVSVDLSQMATGTTFHASMLQLPEGVEVSNKFGLDTVIASVVTVAEETITAPAEGEAAADAAAPAAETPAA
ncbi:MAG: 50S ribosomal protein L25/general stress protein Ctc [Sutterella sp.]|nr:50S ribosomal protein L25/general stress protein Ctc [Sutterella sp.]